MTTDTRTASFAPDPGHHPHAHAHHVHVVPVWLLLGVFGGLIVLTWATVAVTAVDLGAGNIFVAMLIAVLKAGLVAMFFMHLRWDSPFNGLILVSSLLFVAIFIAIALMDSVNYRHNVEAKATDTAATATP